MPNYISDTESDDESQGSWNETDDETETSELLYEPEEPSLTKYNIVLCELYNNTHGTPNINSQHLYYNYLTIYRFLYF